MTKHEKEVSKAVAEFEKLTMEEREELAFGKCGCRIAYPTWWMREDGSTEQVDCVHLGCRIARGEFKRPENMVRFNAEFRSELRSGWLKFLKETHKGRQRAAALYRAMKKHGKFEIMAAVWAGVLG